MGIRQRFSLVIILVFLAGLLISGYMSYQLLQDKAVESVEQKAGVMMGAASAIRTYTVQQIRPHLEMQMMREFLPQSVPAYSATETFNKLRELYPEYTYKEATLNPTNPRDRAVEWEADIVNTFRNHIRDSATGQSLYLARPITIKDGACLLCHSTPDVAPETMIAKYGNSNGFNWQIGETVGAQIVTVPMDIAIKAANQSFSSFVASLITVFVLVFIVVNFLLGRLIIKPVTRMSEHADKISTGDMSLPELDEHQKDEIGVLASSFNRMRRSLQQAMKMLNE
jgi:protein-histidine pros-kinase